MESGVSPGFTELDEVQDEELRNRSWRDFIANTRSAGDPDMLDLLETGVRPKDLESAFAVICGNEDVEFPPGDAKRPDPKPAFKALEKFWTKLEKLLPSHAGRGDHMRDPEGGPPISSAAPGRRQEAGSTGNDRGPARHVEVQVQDHPEVVG